MDIIQHTNRLLSVLPAKSLTKLLIGAERVLLREPSRNEAFQNFSAGAYFPLSGILAIEMTLSNGATVEVGVVGREGVMMQFDAVRATPANRLIVRRGGVALRVNLQHVFDLCLRDEALNQLVHRRWASSLSVMSQLVACNRHHRIEQQLSRWLLDYLDHDDLFEVRITQERIAAALGVRREGVTAALGNLQDTGAIDIGRGALRVRDRPILERVACECYPIIRDLRRSVLRAA